MRARKLGIALMILGLGGGVLWMTGGRFPIGDRSVPYHNDKPVPRLVRKAVLEGDGIRPDHELVEEIGVEAVPFLVDWLTYEDPWHRSAWRRLWPKIPSRLRRASWQPPNFDEWEVRNNAFNLLGRFGTNAKPAVPVAIKMLKNGREQDEAMELLGDIGPAAKQAVPELVTHLEERDKGAIQALREIGPPAKLAVPELEAYLKEATNTVTRIELARALYSIDGKVQVAFSAFKSALKAKDPQTVKQALFALETVDERADKAMDIFVEHLSHENDPIFQAAVGGLITAGKLKTNVPVDEAMEIVSQRLIRQPHATDILPPYVLGLLATQAEGSVTTAISALETVAENPKVNDNVREYAKKALTRIRSAIN